MDVVFAPEKVLTNTLQFAFIFLYISHPLRCFTILPPRRNFSLVAPYSLKFTRCSLLVVKSLVTCCKICSLLVAEVVRCKESRYSLQNLLVTRCRSCSLQKITRYSFQNSLVTRCRSCSLQNSLVTRCKIRSLLVAEVASCKNSLATPCKIRSLLIAEVESLFVTLWKRISTTGAFLWIFAKL